MILFKIMPGGGRVSVGRSLGERQFFNDTNLEFVRLDKCHTSSVYPTVFVPLNFWSRRSDSIKSYIQHSVFIRSVRPLSISCLLSYPVERVPYFG